MKSYFTIYEWIDGNWKMIDREGIKALHMDERQARLDFESCKVLHPNGQFSLVQGIGVARKLIEAKI